NPRRRRRGRTAWSSRNLLCGPEGCAFGRSPGEGAELDEVLREEQVERPVERDAELLLRARQLAEIDRPPEPPGEEAGEIDAEDARDAGPPPDRSELAERREAER